MLVEKVKGALRLAAVDRAALRLGLTPGLTLADARARTPDIRSVPHRPDADAALLARVLEDFGRFTPMAATDGADALILDITGCDHLFGDEVELVRALRRRADRIGLSVRTALANTPQAARALSRFGKDSTLNPERQGAALRRLPVTALELPEREEQALLRAGLKTLGDVDDRADAALAARFGTGFPARLARTLGREDIRITPARPPAPCVMDRVFAEPIGRMEDVERVLDGLLGRACAWLELHGQGGRTFEAAFFRVDGAVRRIALNTGRPSRDAPGVMRLFRERLAALSSPLDPGFGFDQMRLSVPLIQPLAETQGGLERRTPGAEALGPLIDRLTARLGPDAVLRFEPNESHLPERAARAVPLGHPRTTAWPELDPADPPLRPLQLFNPPQPIETLAVVPDGSPLRFRWRRVLHEVVRAEGPERIAGEWWRDRRPTRDYYRVEDRDGRRFWLFRAGLYGEKQEPRWFIHGLFA